MSQNPEYILVKRWVPKKEQEELWSLTKTIRGDREQVTTTLHVEERGRHHRSKSRDKNLVLVRKKEHRSKSPGGLVMYLAGAK